MHAMLLAQNEPVIMVSDFSSGQIQGLSYLLVALVQMHTRAL